MKQILTVCLLLFVALGINAQKDIPFINQEMQNLEVKLLKKGEYLKLTNQQITQLTSIFEDKGQRVAHIKSKNTDKDAISAALIKIEEEFAPKVNTILTKDQRIALQSSVQKSK